MSKIKASDLLKLGFKKRKNVPVNAMDMEYHYYVYEVKKKTLLISNSNDEVQKGMGYSVEIWEIPDIQFTKLKDLKRLIKVLKSATKK